MDQDVIDLYRHLEAQADAIRELAAHVHAAEARIVDMVREFTADARWNQGDWKSVSHWLGVNCGYAPAEANALATVIEKASVMPTVMDHARAGEVSMGVAAMAARVATEAIDANLAEIVTTATPNQTRRLLSKFRELRKQEPGSKPDGEPLPHPDDYWWTTWFDDNGNGRVDAKLPPDLTALLNEAYAAARRSCERDRLSDDEMGDDTKRTSIPVTDTIGRLGTMVLDQARAWRLTRPGGEPFTVMVLVDLQTFMSNALRYDSTCRVEKGPDVTPDLVRQLAESGTVELIFHRDGVPLKLGREFRLASREQRRALRFRDGGCSVPGCSQTRYLHVHHVVWWENGGDTDIENLVLLCPWHHRLIHQHGWSVVKQPGQRFVFYDRSGRVVGNRHVEARRDGRPPPGRLDELPEQQQLGIGPDTSLSIGAGETLTNFGADVWMHSRLTAALRDTDDTDDTATAAA